MEDQEDVQPAEEDLSVHNIPYVECLMIQKGNQVFASLINAAGEKTSVGNFKSLQAAENAVQQEAGATLELIEQRTDEAFNYFVFWVY